MRYPPLAFGVREGVIIVSLLLKQGRGCAVPLLPRMKPDNPLLAFGAKEGVVITIVA